MGALVSTMVLALAVVGLPRDLARMGCLPLPDDRSYLLTDTNRRVRGLTPRLADALAAGAWRSPTFLHLLRTLQSGDVIVQMLDEPALDPTTAAQLSIIPVPGEVRFLRVRVGPGRSGDDLVALLGHELAHAVEIAREPQVRDSQSLRSLYTRIGFGLARHQQYDSHGANDLEQRIRHELEAFDECIVAAR